jgi:tripartite ATP-independent transporter DctM subunit
LTALVVDVVPLFTIVFVVIGFIVLGIATPTESAALGALATLLITVYYRRFSFEMVKRALAGTLEITGMVFLIVAGSITFSRVLGFSGASRELVVVVQEMELTPVMILIVIQLLTILLGTFMDQASMIMLIAPMAMPIVESTGIDPIWFVIVFLLSMEIGLTSPPFGLMNFVMKGAVEDLTMVEIWKAGLPFIICDLIAMALLLAFPVLVMWLPNVAL